MTEGHDDGRLSLAQRLTRTVERDERVTEHYAEAVFSEPGQCWRFVPQSDPRAMGQPMHCPEPVVVRGSHRLKGGRRIPAWSCEGHSEEIDGTAVWPSRYNDSIVTSRGSMTSSSVNPGL
jgi:hypothetical protein